MAPRPTQSQQVPFASAMLSALPRRGMRTVAIGACRFSFSKDQMGTLLADLLFSFPLYLYLYCMFHGYEPNLSYSHSIGIRQLINRIKHNPPSSASLSSFRYPGTKTATGKSSRGPHASTPPSRDPLATPPPPTCPRGTWRPSGQKSEDRRGHCAPSSGSQASTSPTAPRPAPCSIL